MGEWGLLSLADREPRDYWLMRVWPGFEREPWTGHSWLPAARGTPTVLSRAGRAVIS